MNSRLKLAASITALAAVYLAAGKIGLTLAFVNASTSAVWPPTGLALAALLLWGYRLWPGLFLGALLVNVLTPGAYLTDLSIAAGNTLEALAGAWLVNRFTNGARAFERAGDIFKFVILAGGLSTVVSASIGVTSLCLGGEATWERFPAIWLTWWMGDMAGALVVAPLIIIWVRNPSLRHTQREFFEATGALVATSATAVVLFMGGFPSVAANQFKYLAVLPLLWAAFRRGRRGAITSAALLSGIALWGTLHSVGPFVTPDPNQSLLLLQVFMGTLTVMTLVVAAVVTERKRAEQRLQVRDAVNRVLAEAPTLQAAAPKIIHALCATAGWQAGAVWKVDRTANALVCVEFWRVPDTDISEFESISRQHTFAPGVGLPGRVWSGGRAVWVPDVTKDDNFPRAPSATNAGLHAGVCFPIQLGGEVLGVLECFSRRVRRTDRDFLQMLDDIGGQVGQFIMRKQAEEAHLELLRREQAARAEAEKQLSERRQAEQRFRQVVELAPNAIIMANERGRIVLANAVAEKLFGYTRQEFVELTVEQLIPERYRGQHSSFRTAFHAQPEARAMGAGRDLFGLRKDGTEVPVEIGLSPVRTAEGAFVLAAIVNITERKRAEIMLRQAHDELEERVLERTMELTRANTALRSEARAREQAELGRARLAAIVEYSSDAILSKTLGGTITSWNQGAERMFGYSAAEVIGRPVSMLVPPNRADELGQALDQIARGEAVEPWETVRVRKDGRRLDVALTLSSVRNAAGHVIGASAIMRDVSERKRLEGQILQTSEREQRRIAQDLHDGLGQQLAGLWCLSDVLQKNLEAESSRQAAEAARMTRLLNAAVTLNRGLARGLYPVPAESNGLMTALEELAARVTDLFKISCRFECAQPVLIEDNSAATNLYRIAQEAITNAVRHGRAQRVEIVLSSGPDAVTLVIRDNGVGFHKPARPGKGLGLHIMKYRAAVIGGHLAVQKKSGGGTEVICAVRQMNSESPVAEAETNVKESGTETDLHRR